MLSTLARLMAWNARAFNPIAAFSGWGGGMTLRGMTDDQLQVLASQSGVSYELLKTQQRAEMASAGSTGDVGEEQLIPTVEIQLKSNAKNPKKARKQNIKMLRKALKPPSYNLGLFKIYRYNAAHECACCGVDIRRFLEGDNAYAHIVDDAVGLSLADIYWFDEETGNARKPLARTHGDHGDEMNSTLCPAHLHIFHTLRSIVQEQEMANDGILMKPVSKGTKFMKVPGMKTLMRGSTAQNRSTPDSLMKYEPFFEMIHKDIQHSKGVQLNQLPNPTTGVVDIITITFDLRAIQSETMLAQRNAMARGMNMQNQMNNAILAGQQAAINASNEG